MTQSLTQAERDAYAHDGYLVPRHRLPAERVSALHASVDRLIEANPGVRPEKLISAHIEGRSGEGVVGSRDFLELAREPAILDMVGQLIGPDIVLWGCHVFCKPAGDGLETPWHQDGQYWPIRPLATCTVWVAIERSDRDNGCLRVIPGSHRAGRLHPHDALDGERVLNLRVGEGAFDPAAAVDLELDPGQMSMHDVYMIHGAQPNRSGRRRTGVALRYMPASSVFERDGDPGAGRSGVPVAFATRPLWLLRGRDASGRNDFITGHPPGRSGLPGAMS